MPAIDAGALKRMTVSIRLPVRRATISICRSLRSPLFLSSAMRMRILDPSQEAASARSARRAISSAEGPSARASEPISKKTMSHDVRM